MNTIAVNSYSFNYVEYGSGRPVVFVHGSASDYRTWRAQLDAFGKQFRAIAYSRRYHWPNEEIADGEDYEMAQHVRDLEAFLQSVDAVPADLVGHSYGAFVCLLLAMRAPHLVRSLVLAEPPAITLFVSNSPRPLELLKLLCTRPRTAVAIIKFGAQGVGPATAALKRNDMEEALEVFGCATLGTNTFRALSEARREQASANLIKAELLGSGFPPIDDAQVREIQIPVLLVSGRSSRTLFDCLLERLQELLLHAEHIEIPGASHIMHEDNVEAYNAAVSSFLAAVGKPSVAGVGPFPALRHNQAT